MKLRTVLGMPTALAVAALASAGLGTGQATVVRPVCRGAEARDPGRTCRVAVASIRVSPTPEQAQLVPDAACTPEGAPPGAELVPCGFGAAAGPGVQTVALLGDSHAAHWRAALDVVARREGWHAESMTRSGCGFANLPEPAPDPRGAACRRLNREIIAWFGAHPEVRTVFVSAFATEKVTLEPGLNRLETKVREATAAWDALPASVEHIIVLRDVHLEPQGVFGCVESAVAHRRPPVACTIERRRALFPDPLAVAAGRLASPRVRTIDMTPFFCGPERCSAVVGGVLTHKDSGHLTRAYSASLGPFLLTRVRALLGG